MKERSSSFSFLPVNLALGCLLGILLLPVFPVSNAAVGCVATTDTELAAEKVTSPAEAAIAVVSTHAPRAATRGLSAMSPLRAPAFPGKKGLQSFQERGGFQPRFLLRDADALSLKDRELLSVTGVAETLFPDTMKVLGLLVRFSDLSFAHERAFIERHLFFMSQYFDVVSGGKLELTIVASDSIFSVPQTMAYYGQDDDLGLRLVELARDAVAVSDSLIDFTQYDKILVIHAGLGQEADVFGNSPEQIWSASLGPAEFEYYLPDSLGNIGIATNDTLPDGSTKYISQIVIVPEDESQDTYNFSPFGVYVHEFGHLLGMPDLYDTDPPGGADSQGIGNWGLMGTGLWNWNGYIPAEPCAWTRAVMGWKPVRVVSVPGTCELTPSEGANLSGEIVLVPLGGREYFLIENRLQDLNGNNWFDFDDANSNGSFDFYEDSYAGAEFDYFLPGYGSGSGLLVWHIDEQQIETYMPRNMVNADRYHKGVDLEEADGVEDLDVSGYLPENYGSAFDSYREGNNTELTPSTVPNSDGSYGGKSLVYLEDVGPAGETMSLTVNFGMREGTWPFQAEAAFGTNHPNCADLDGNGTLELIVCERAGNLYILEGDGTAYPMAPLHPAKALGEEVFSSPAVGDIDGDGSGEIVVVTAAGTVFAWNAEDMSEVMDGDSNPATDGVLVRFDPVGRTSVVLSDWNGDGVDEILFGCSITSMFDSLPFITSVDGEGSLLPGPITNLQEAVPDSIYPFYVLRLETDSVRIGAFHFPEPTFRAAVASDFNGDGEKEILVSTGSGSGAGRLYLVPWCFCYFVGLRLCLCPELTGVTTEFAEVILADLDRDGEQEIIGADVSGALHAMHASVELMELTELPGWPVQLADPADSQVAAISAGEIDGDGRLEVLAALSGRAFAVNYNGTLLPGWPPRLTTRSYGFGTAQEPLCVDVNADNAADFVGSICDSRLLAIGADGGLFENWPIVAGSVYGTSPIVADLDGDGLAELALVRDVGVGLEIGDSLSPELSGEVDVLSLGIPFVAASAWWPQYRRDPAHSGAIPDTLIAAPPLPGEFVSELYAMPNPARGQSVTLHYTLSEAVDRVRVEIYDLAGRLTYSASPPAFAASDNNHTVGLGSFAPGVYLFAVEAIRQDGTSQRAFSKLAILK